MHASRCLVHMIHTALTAPVGAVAPQVLQFVQHTFRGAHACLQHMMHAHRSRRCCCTPGVAAPAHRCPPGPLGRVCRHTALRVCKGVCKCVCNCACKCECKFVCECVCDCVCGGQGVRAILTMRPPASAKCCERALPCCACKQLPGRGMQTVP